MKHPTLLDVNSNEQKVSPVAHHWSPWAMGRVSNRNTEKLHVPQGVSIKLKTLQANASKVLYCTFL